MFKSFLTPHFCKTQIWVLCNNELFEFNAVNGAFMADLGQDDGLLDGPKGIADDGTHV